MNVNIIKMRRKTISLKIEKDLSLTVKAPLFMKDGDIEKFIESHKSWIEKSSVKVTERQRQEESITPEIRAEYIKKAKEYLPKATKYYADIMGLYPTSIRITDAKTRFGSCSPKNGICYSWRLMMYPKDAIDYVVVHELAHIRVKNHGRDFYALVEKFMPDYKERNKKLRRIENGTN